MESPDWKMSPYEMAATSGQSEALRLNCWSPQEMGDLPHQHQRKSVLRRLPLKA